MRPRCPRAHRSPTEWLAHVDAVATADAVEAVIRTRAQKVVDIWNTHAEPLYYPTFRTALRTGHRWLTFMCPACRQIGEVELAQLDYHPDAAISALIPRLSCTRCCPNPPHARLLKLARLALMPAPIGFPTRR